MIQDLSILGWGTHDSREKLRVLRRFGPKAEGLGLQGLRDL